MNKEKLMERAKQFIRYFFVGGIASVVDYGFANMAYLLLGKWAPLAQNELLLQNISAVSGIVVGLLVNYFMALKLVFDSEKSLKDFLQICLITIVSCLLTFGLTTMNVHFLHVPFALFKIVTMGIAFIWNYLARSLWVYNKESDKISDKTA